MYSYAFGCWSRCFFSHVFTKQKLLRNQVHLFKCKFTIALFHLHFAYCLKHGDVFAEHLCDDVLDAFFNLVNAFESFNGFLYEIIEVRSTGIATKNFQRNIFQSQCFGAFCQGCFAFGFVRSVLTYAMRSNVKGITKNMYIDSISLFLLTIVLL